MTTTSRRSILKGLVATLAATGATGIARVVGDATPASASPTDSARPWYLQTLAKTRETTSEEAMALTKVARAAAVEEGYSASIVAAAPAQSTMSVNPLGNKVGKCALIIDDQSVFVLTKEYGRNALNRQAAQTLWTDGEKMMRDLVPSHHAKLLAAGTTTDSATTLAASSCCAPLGSAIGTCCEYDFQGLFECCGPCAFTLPSTPTFIACVAIWCAYCNASHCTTWYHGC